MYINILFKIANWTSIAILSVITKSKISKFCSSCVIYMYLLELQFVKPPFTYHGFLFLLAQQNQRVFLNGCNYGSVNSKPAHRIVSSEPLNQVRIQYS